MQHRKTLRLKGYDYSSNGYYFITICTYNKEELFGEIINEKMKLNNIGVIAKKYWAEIPQHYENVEIDIYQIMPNHIHGIIIINNDQDTNVVTEHCSVTNVDNENTNPSNNSVGLLSKIIKSYKEVVKKEIKHKQNNNYFAWQRSFYDRIIRNDKELENIRKYLHNNPKKSELEKFDIENAPI